MIERQQPSVQYNPSLEEYIGGNSTISDPVSAQDAFLEVPGEEDAFAKDLNRLQEQQIAFSQKLAKEKQRKDALELRIQKTKEQLKIVQVKTKSGDIVKDFEVINQRQIGKMEHLLQMSKVKLSVAKNVNSKLKKTVTEKRQEKMLQLQILNDLAKETEEAQSTAKTNKKEIALINDLKLKTKLAITKTKNQMVKDAEVFSTEIDTAKKNISSAQNDILTNIRESMEATSLACESIKIPDAPTTAEETPIVVQQGLNKKRDIRKQEIETILHHTDFSSIEEMLMTVQQSEKDMFIMYNETQEKFQEVEKLDVENKNFEEQVEAQIRKLKDLEVNQDIVKQDLEKHIQSLRTFIEGFEADYNSNLRILESVSEELTNLLKHLAVDDDVADQQLLYAGITDRNLNDVLGLIEQRIDELIQMSKAVANQTLRQEDFINRRTYPSKAGSSNNSTASQPFQAPMLPSLVNTSDNGVLFQDLIDTTNFNHQNHLGDDGANILTPINVQDFKTAMQKRNPQINAVR